MARINVPLKDAVPPPADEGIFLKEMGLDSTQGRMLLHEFMRSIQALGRMMKYMPDGQKVKLQAGLVALAMAEWQDSHTEH